MVPEFPGQTHAFFWRELAGLRAEGIDAETVSTRRPPPSIVCHDWAREAMGKTVYLYPPSPASLWSGLCAFLAAGPRRWARCLQAVWSADHVPVLERWRIAPLVLVGADLAALVSVKATRRR